MGREGYLADAKTQDAVERCFQRISEAAVKLGDDADARYPEIPWRDIRRFGNVLRHEYDAVGHDLGRRSKSVLNRCDGLASRKYCA